MYCKNCGRKIYISDGEWIHEETFTPQCFELVAEPRDEAPEEGELFSDSQKRRLKRLVDGL